MNTTTENGHHPQGPAIREYFAAMAMQGMCAAERDGDGYWRDEELAMRAVRRADALIAELAKVRS